MSLSPLPIKVGNSSFMNVCNQSPLRLAKMQDQTSLMLCWRSFSWWGRECVSIFFDYKGGQYIKNRQQHTKVNILWLTVGYLHLTINRHTRAAELEIGTDGCTQTWPNLHVHGSWSWFLMARGSRSGFWMCLGPNGTVFGVQTRTAGWLPRFVADTINYCFLVYSSAGINWEDITAIVRDALTLCRCFEKGNSALRVTTNKWWQVCLNTWWMLLSASMPASTPCNTLRPMPLQLISVQLWEQPSSVQGIDWNIGKSAYSIAKLHYGPCLISGCRASLQDLTDTTDI